MSPSSKTIAWMVLRLSFLCAFEALPPGDQVVPAALQTPDSDRVREADLLDALGEHVDSFREHSTVIGADHDRLDAKFFGLHFASRWRPSGAVSGQVRGAA
jgi:hypothetical protein